jgi:hypothetical protein
MLQLLPGSKGQEAHPALIETMQQYPSSDHG